MQLQLFPPAPHPQILFSFTLPVLPPSLPFPAAYTAQLQLLLHTELEPPPSPYVLDKAVWAVHLIELVIFDLANRHVQVKMVDGACMEWTMRGEELLLNQVMEDVEASKNEAEREQREQERKDREEIAAAAAAASAAAAGASGTYLPLSQQHSVSDVGHGEKCSSSAKTPHRRSKSLFSSLLSALNLHSVTEASTSSSEYRIGCGRGRKDQLQSPSSGDVDGDEETFTYPAYAITALSTSEYTYPMRAQLATNDFPASKVLRRRARSTLVDCFRRWIIPTVRERLAWGCFPPFDAIYNDSLGDDYNGEGVKWGKMSKATNAYADWACRSMISRCERALRTASATAAMAVSQENTPTEERRSMDMMMMSANGTTSDKDSRRSSASSMPVSAISASSRASSSAEASEPDADAFAPSPAAPTFQSAASASTKASRRSSASIRHVATLKTALDRFKNLHEKLAMEAIGLADAHSGALHVLEARGRRRGWSATEGGGLGRSPLGTRPVVSSSSSSSPPNRWGLSSPDEHAYGSGSSFWELSIPLVRSTLGEISDTWEDWQMEWEMEKEFGSEGEDELDEEDFPGIISEFDTSGDSLLPRKPQSRKSDATASTTLDDEDPTECGHSGFSDSSSSEDEMDSDDVNDRSPTSPSELEESAVTVSVEGGVVRARRGRRTGVKARMGKYEDVRNELPPDPPLMALSPPPRGKFATRPSTSREAGIGSSPLHGETGAEKSTGRPPRSGRPARLQVPPAGSSHRREPASAAAYPDFAQSRVDDVEAGVFDEWDGVDDEDNVFGRPSNPAPGLPSGSDKSQRSKAFHMFDGLGILEQVGGAAEAAQAIGPAYVAANEVGVGYPPGLHGDLPSPPSSPKRAATLPDSPRRVSHYVSRDLPPTTEPAPPVVMEKDTKKTPRARPRLTLAFPDPPSHDPAKARSASLPYVRAYQPSEDLVGARPVEKDAPALLLDTPTAEHPSSTYPYTWEVNVLPPGIKVVGTVGVSGSSDVEQVPEVPSSTEASSGNTASTSSSSRPFNAVAKVFSKVRKVKPVLYVTPPLPSDDGAEKPPAPRRLQKLNRSKSWKDLSSGNLNVRPDNKRRKSADSVPTRSEPEAEPVPAPVPNATADTEAEAEEDGDKTVVLEGTPCLSPTSTLPSDLESGCTTPMLVSASSSAFSSPLSSVNSTALDIADMSAGSMDPALNLDGSETYDGIVMGSNAHVVTSGERRPIQEALFAEPMHYEAGSEGDGMSLDEALKLEPTTSACPVAGQKTLKRATSTTRFDRPPPPPRPPKSLKRSLSLNAFGKKSETPVAKE
ncbi:hypothetical protein M408DRAFT_331018 [Serendipita vermifera MAFF 305830]|uniref:Uncharacterized protein n=1 Tax=Serendipita vermifera MAFF 305830 TaxID=933852 RepID=A0A0C2WGY7_SERVB|nr:hypothetical protein M408DRAFT_331018 [Serendipita vermifera MAFF 305830]